MVSIDLLDQDVCRIRGLETAVEKRPPARTISLSTVYRGIEEGVHRSVRRRGDHKEDAEDECASGRYR